jgi:hypothetical protein
VGAAGMQLQPLPRQLYRKNIAFHPGTSRSFFLIVDRKLLFCNP